MQYSNRRHENNLEKYEQTHIAKALVLSCIDYRFIDDVIFSLEEDQKLSQRYDLTALAGSSLAYNQKEYKHWRKTILDQINLAIELHHIKKLIIFDHMDCGAYQMFYPDLKANSEEERVLHFKNITKFINKMKKIFPQLIYSGYLIHTDKTIEPIVVPY